MREDPLRHVAEHLSLPVAAIRNRKAAFSTVVRAQANMYLYKVNVDASQEPLPPVILDDQGAPGMYNRANRSLHHFVENMPGLILCFLPAAYCFPLVRRQRSASAQRPPS